MTLEMNPEGTATRLDQDVPEMGALVGGREQGGETVGEAGQSDESYRRIVIWIDHRTAILTIFEGEYLEAESVFHSTAGPHIHGGGWSQHRIQAHNHELLKHFYDEVIQHLGSPDEIFVLGPGQAKYELRKRIEHHRGLKGKMIGLHHATRISPDELIVMYASALAMYRDIEKLRQEDLLSAGA
jgi:hypothetical protein